jgi:hypothetical protein
MDIAWVWYGFRYWVNPSFFNHLRARWYHYKFCKGRAEVFRIQLYLGEWKQDIESILIKRPKAIIPSHGFFAILKMIEEKKVQKLVAFLDSENVKEGIAAFIEELKMLNSTINEHYLETLPALNKNDSSKSNNNVIETSTPINNIPTTDEVTLNSKESPDDEHVVSAISTLEINARTYIIATQIYYELYRSRQEYLELKQSMPQYLIVIKQLFNANLSNNISKLKSFDYQKILNENKATQKGQLRRQLEQIKNNPRLFSERVAMYVDNLLKKHFH